MNSYTKKVADNILPLSISTELKEAFKEWFFTENTIDHEEAIEECELCNHEQLRYQFEIKNKYTRKKLWVGSSCILRFELTVYENGLELNKQCAEKKLNNLIKKMQHVACIKALETLSEKEQNDILRNALRYYKKNKYLTPKYGFVVFWRLQSNNIEYHPSFFKISLKTNKYLNDLAEMQTERVQLLWPALTSSQRKIAERYGHKKKDI